MAKCLESPWVRLLELLEDGPRRGHEGISSFFRKRADVKREHFGSHIAVPCLVIIPRQPAEKKEWSEYPCNEGRSTRPVVV